MKKMGIPQVTSPLSKWLFYLRTLHSKTIDMELARISQVASRLDIWKPAPFVFTVTGTNGKGTTCRILEAILMASGFRVGVYSSPHLLCYTERIRIQNTELPESLHTASFSEIESVRDNIPLTYFEYSTLSAIRLLKQAHLDIVILEVGLGGRLDATNIVNADVAVVTNIALEHTDWLGPDRKSIGREKAGIFRFGKPAVVGELDMPYTVAMVAKKKGAHLLRYGINWLYVVKDDGWSFIDDQGLLDNLPLPQVPLPNAATALAALRFSGLEIRRSAIYTGIRDATLPGRFLIVSLSPRVILDVAHNPHAAVFLTERLASLPKTGKILTVIGMLCDKDMSNTLSNLENIVDFWYCASLKDIPRGASAEQLIKHIIQGKKTYYTAYVSVQKALLAALNDAKLGDTVLVCGSFYTVARAMNVIHSERINGK